ncbi:MAG TPA: hypothetical protein PK929_14505, partial [Quisquiliibacterium sp.]|nr:hypothetical protein [Quisquiliibacterium sp.]
GVVVKGPAVAGEVCVYKLSNGQPDAASTQCTTIGADGTYGLQVAANLAEVLLEARNVEYLDEANNGARTTLVGQLRSVIAVPAAGGSGTATISALTTMAYDALAGRSTPVSAAAFAAEAAKVAQAFGLSDNLVTGRPQFEGAAIARNAYAQALAGLAQYARQNGTPVQTSIRNIALALGTTGANTYQNALQTALNNYCTLAGLSSCPTIRLDAYGGTTPVPPTGGTAICRVLVNGTITVSSPAVPGGSITTPISQGVCLQNFPTAGCDANLNSGLNFNQLLQQIPGFAAGALTYQYSSPAACPATDVKFNYNNGAPVLVP